MTMPVEQKKFDGHIYISGMYPKIRSENERANLKMKLSKLSVGSKGVIMGNVFSGNIRRRLWDIGFCDGSVVECVGESLFCDPRAYLVKGTIIAVRNIDAEKIFVQKSGI